jgi:hypothetical protein
MSAHDTLCDSLAFAMRLIAINVTATNDRAIPNRARFVLQEQTGTRAHSAAAQGAKMSADW